MKQLGLLDPPRFNHFRLGFRPAFDGLRGIAMLAVLACHAAYVVNPEDAGRYFPGAFVSVDCFFALSGFLITSLLLTEINRTDKLSFRGFYRRRALRLFPVLYFTLAVQFIYTLIVGDGIWHDLEGIFFIAIYISNWAQVFHWPQPFGTQQTWSLGVEEQFYLMWPLVLYGITKIQRRRYAVLPFLFLAGVSLISREIIWHASVGWNTIYVQTEVRLDVLMFGSLMAYLLHTGWKPPKYAVWVGYVSTIFLVYIVWKTYATEAWLYRGGFTVEGFACAGLVFLTLDSVNPVGRFLSIRPLQWVGRRSYSIYLSHYLVFLAIVRAYPHGNGTVRTVVAIAMTFALAEICHRAVEKPFLTIKNNPSAEPRPVAA